jgi:ABC-2 type transport system permease protein
MLAIMRKELADSFNSFRFLVLFLLVLVASGLGVYAMTEGIRSVLEQNHAVTSNGFVFLAMFTSSFPGLTFLDFATIVAIIVPITGIILGFDAINSERTGGTMSLVLAQPVYRDSVINGKFLAGLITLALMVGTAILLMAGFGIRIIGVPPTAEEIIRLFIYFVVTVVYGVFWMALAILFSILFRRAAGSLLVPIVLFIVLYFLWVFLGLGSALANAIVPVTNSSPLEVHIHNAQLQETLLRISPAYLFQEAVFFMINPSPIGLGIVTMEQASYILLNPLSLAQSLLAVWPHIVGLISLSAIFFAISYVVFMKQEVRAT